MSDSKEEIMEATYSALCKHGYADLSIQKIADESDKAKSAIYYHYDGKDDLMLAFLDYLEEKIREKHSGIEDLPPQQKLEETLNMALGIKEDNFWSFQKALLEIRAEGPHKDGFAGKIKEIDQRIVSNMCEVMEELGVDNPDLTAEVLVSCIGGAADRKVSTQDKEGLEDLKRAIKDIAQKYVVEGCGCE